MEILYLKSQLEKGWTKWSNKTQIWTKWSNKNAGPSGHTKCGTKWSHKMLDQVVNGSLNTKIC
jgi:hypothetical protein